MSYETSRLSVDEITSDLSAAQLSRLLAAIPHILTADVVKNLPPYFHGITTEAEALLWFKRMMEESRLWMVTDSKQGHPIGFIFAFVEHTTAHIGYLLKQSHWGKGLASELLKAFINEVTHTGWRVLIGGVDRSNIASAKLLLKLGFVERIAQKDSGVVFYEYWLVEPTQ